MRVEFKVTGRTKLELYNRAVEALTELAGRDLTTDERQAIRITAQVLAESYDGRVRVWEGDVDGWLESGR